jgi:hypothetical protein
MIAFAALSEARWPSRHSCSAAKHRSFFIEGRTYEPGLSLSTPLQPAADQTSCARACSTT